MADAMNTPGIINLVLAITFASSALAEPPAPTRVLKLWEGKPPGDFTVPGPETVTEPKPTDKTPDPADHQYRGAASRAL